MPSVCFYFQVHQPYRLRHYSFFDIGHNHMYEDDEANKSIMLKVADKCYLPMNSLLLKLINQHKGNFRVSFSLSGVFIEQMVQYAPEVLKSFQELVDTGCVEILAETYAHSVSFLFSPREWMEQIALHDELVKTYFHVRPTAFRNTELIYNNDIAQMAEQMGYQAILTEGADQVINWRSPNFVYQPGNCRRIRLLLKNYRLSDDIAFRFSNQGWEEYPLQEHISAAIPNSMICIESDRTCYILGEVIAGCARNCDNAVFMAVGTGIGLGILIDGVVLHGNSDIVGAIGWMALKPPYDSFYDKCGCFETHASGDGLATQARKFLTLMPEYKGELRDIELEKVTSYHVFRAYENNDEIAVKVIDQAIEMWGMAAANVVSLFNPQILVFGGGVFGPAAQFIGRIYEEACKWAQPISIREVKFMPTALPKLAGLYGAGAIAINIAKKRKK